ncbi:MAG: metallophosphoesterase [Planctomycetota bacterium]
MLSVLLRSALVAALSVVAFPHDPEVQLNELAAKIAATPEDAALYLQRGEILRQERRFGAALADFERALTLSPRSRPAALARAGLLWMLGRDEAALAAADACLALHPDSTDAQLLRARALARLDRPAEAVAAYDRALAAAAVRRPEFYVERADVAAKLDVADALAGLDRGVADLGAVSLQQHAVVVAEGAGRYAEAVRRLDDIVAAVQRPRHWLQWKARLLRRAGDRAAAARATALAATDPRTSPPGSGLPATSAALTSASTSTVPPISAPASTATTLIPRGATWRYRDDGTDQGTAWSQLGFDDSTWASGPAQLGYGDGDEQTVVSFGPNPLDKYITTYFRHTFQVSNPAAFNLAHLGLLRDDGAVVYLNGTEIARSNMPTGAIQYRTLASLGVGGPEENFVFHFAFPPTLLRPAPLDNVLAVEIHQFNAASSDISFDAELVGADVASVVRGPYLQMGGHDRAVVRWRTDVATSSRVWFGAAPGNLTQVATVPALTTEHVVELTGLTADTRSYYAVGHDQQVLRGADNDHWWWTAPTPGTAKPTRVWVIGDSGTFNLDAYNVREAYLGYTGTRRTDVWLMLGDNAYTYGTDAEYQNAVFLMYEPLLRNTFLFPTLGNHDAFSASSSTESGVYYDVFSLPRQGELGGMASGTEAYYSFDHGDIHFVCLDSQDTPRTSGSPMLTWLQADLANNTRKWLVAFFHHPPYTKGSHDSDNPADSGGRMTDMRSIALPLLEAGGVDLVLTGHSHCYERSFLLDGHYGLSSTLTSAMVLDRGDGRAAGDGTYAKSTAGPAPHEGAVYAVAGSSGQISGGSLDHPAMFVSMNTLGSMVLDIDGNELDAVFLDDQGAVRDSFTLVKGERRTLRRIEPGISQSQGGQQNLVLDAGPTYANKGYVVAGSLGTTPGFSLGGVHIPLNPDVWFDLTLQLANSGVYQGSIGFLDGAGQAAARIQFPAFNNPSLVGAAVYHAYWVFDGNRVLTASNPVKLTITQ